MKDLTLQEKKIVIRALGLYTQSLLESMKQFIHNTNISVAINTERCLAEDLSAEFEKEVML